MVTYNTMYILRHPRLGHKGPRDPGTRGPQGPDTNNESQAILRPGIVQYIVQYSREAASKLFVVLFDW